MNRCFLAYVLFESWCLGQRYDSSSARNRNGRADTSQQNENCPCVKPPGSTTCVAYNPAMQAASLDEAIFNFRNPIETTDPVTAKSINPLRTNLRSLQRGFGSASSQRVGPFACSPSDARCNACYRQMLAWFQQSADFSGDNSTSLQVEQVARKTGFNINGLRAAAGISASNCPELSFLKRPNEAAQFFGGPGQIFALKLAGGGSIRPAVGRQQPPPVAIDDNTLSQLASQIKGDGSQAQCTTRPASNGAQPPPVNINGGQISISPINPWPQTPSNPPFGRWNNRRRRLDPYAPVNPPANLNSINRPGYNRFRRIKRQEGVSATADTKAVTSIDGDNPYQNIMTLDCRSKGVPVDSNSNWCGLCDICWQIVYLKPNYFPPLLNRVSCGSNSKCLSGYGECRSGFRSTSVLKNYGTPENPQWKEFVLNTPNSCECQIRSDSALSNFARR